jgi:hypothetical protein
MDTVTKLIHYKSSVERVFGDGFSILNIFTIEPLVNDFSELLKTDILSAKYDGGYNVESGDEFIPIEHSNISADDVTGPVFRKLLKASDFIILDYHELGTKIETIDLQNNWLNDAFLELFHLQISKIKMFANPQNFKFYFVDTMSLPKIYLSEEIYGIYDYYIVIIGMCENGRIIRLTFGND